MGMGIIFFCRYAPSSNVEVVAAIAVGFMADRSAHYFVGPFHVFVIYLTVYTKDDVGSSGWWHTKWARGINWIAPDSTGSAATSRPRSTPAAPRFHRGPRPVVLLQKAYIERISPVRLGIIIVIIYNIVVVRWAKF